MGYRRARHAIGQADACAEADTGAVCGCSDWLRLWPGSGIAVMQRHPDPGLQPERTTMAWTRTLVSFLVVAGLSMRVSASVHEIAFLLITVIAMMAALNITVRQAGRYERSNTGLVEEKIRPQVWSVIVMSTAVTLLALVLLAMRLM